MSESINDWLKGLGLEQYAQVFRENDVDRDVLPELTADDLIALGVASIGHRRKLLAAIKALRDSPAAAASTSPARSGDASTAPAESAEAAGGERRLLTVMFCDLVGSTELATRLDPEDLREIIGEYHGCVTEVLTRFGGFVAKYMGDGILAYFGYPQAHEEDAEQAVRAGLAIVAAVARLDLPQRLQIRLGIATGLAVVGDLVGAGVAQEQAVVGETPNLAARLQALAVPDSIVIADATRRQVGGLFELRDLGPQSLKGFSGTPHAFEVLTESEVTSRFEALRSQSTPLIGRDEEIELLLRRWDQAKTGEGRAVLISAEPGIGKSRLTEAVEERIAPQPHLRLRYFCSPHHQDSAFYPIIGHMERAAAFARDDDTSTRLRKLGDMAAKTGMPDDDVALLAELLSLPGTDATSAPELTPQRKKEKTFGLLIRALEVAARQQPLLMVFEDIHWIDPTSCELLDRTLACVERLPVLLLATFRPEFQPPWIGQPHVTLMTLPRLGRRHGEALVRRLAGNAAELPADLLDEIVARTDGVPLFLEEVTKAILESADAAGAGGARNALSAIPSHRAAVPATLQASLMARLDRLGPEARDVAQTGAAIGREFSYDIVTAVASRSEADTRAALDRLVASGLVFQRGNPPTADYQFKHALVQDTAYGTLLRGPRQALHERIAAAIETRTPDRVDREPEILAYHLAKAGRFQRAATFALEAGRRAAARSANLEAVAHLRRGVEILAAQPNSDQRMRLELALQLALGPAVMATRGFGAPEAEAAYRRARELSEMLRDSRSLFAALWGLWLAMGQTDEQGHRRDLVDELFRVAEPLNDSGLVLQAHHAAWATQVFDGDLAGSQEHVRQGLKLYDREKHGRHALLYGGHDPAVCGTGLDGIAFWVLGFPDRAAQSVRQSIAYADAIEHPPSLGHALWFTGVTHLLRREPVRVLEAAERLIALSRDRGLAQYAAIGAILRGWAQAWSGERESGLVELRSAIESYPSTAAVLMPLFSISLIDAELAAAHVEGALTAVESLISKRREPIWTPDVLRVRGDLRLAQDDAAGAAQLYNEAIALARSRDAKSLELRAALHLARLLERDGRRTDAVTLLQPLYSWFAEGLDTGDLKDAKALLDQNA
jgi:class 3 adenylate cyclase/tetratricopeptide (TPR) repeat protein